MFSSEMKNTKCMQLFSVLRQHDTHRLKSVRNRLAALATHGRQNCKQSGVVLERTVNWIEININHDWCKNFRRAVIYRKLKLGLNISTILFIKENQTVIGGCSR